MNNLLSSVLMGVFLMTAPAMSMASDCKCSQQCKTACAEGNGKDCKCKKCDCAKTGKCKHGECDTKDKPVEATPAHS